MWVLRKAIEGDDADLIGHLYSVHADAVIGLAGKEKPGSEVRDTKLQEVLYDLGRSLDSETSLIP